jgi:hypothetical protein
MFIADELRGHWHDLELIRQETVERVLSALREQIRVQLDSLPIPERQGLLEQLGIVATWRRGGRLKIVASLVLEYITGDSAPYTNV